MILLTDDENSADFVDIFRTFVAICDCSDMVGRDVVERFAALSFDDDKHLVNFGSG